MNDIDEQLKKYEPLVKKLANIYSSKADMGIPVEDFIQVGLIALWKILKEERYKDNRGAKFETYISPRIKGSFIDLSREEDWVPRNERNTGELVNEMIRYADFPASHDNRNFIDTVVSETTTTRDPLVELLFKEKHMILEKIIDELRDLEKITERDREIFLSDKDQKDIAEFYNVKPPRIIQMQNRTVTRLSERMKEVYA